VHGMEERAPPPWRGRRDASNASMICGVLPIGGTASTDASHTLERMMHVPIIYFFKKNYSMQISNCPWSHTILTKKHNKKTKKPLNLS
jgi:hypothetical protein